MNKAEGKRAVGVIVKGGQILLMKRFRNKEGWMKGWYFVFPGGGVDEGETEEEAVLREMKEELSIDAKIDKLLFIEHNPAKVYEHEGRDEYFYLITDFSGKVELGGPEKERMDENDQFFPTWIPISEIETMDDLYPEVARRKVADILCRKTQTGSVTA